MPAPNKQDDQLNEADLAKLRKAHERYVAAVGRPGSSSPQVTIASTISQGDQKFVVYFRNEADQRRLIDTINSSQVTIASTITHGDQKFIAYFRDEANQKQFADMITALIAARAPKIIPVPVMLRDSKTERRIQVLTQADADRLKEYVHLIDREARASVAPVINVQPAPVQVEIVQLPERKTESTITRNAQGDITKVVQVEKSVA